MVCVNCTLQHTRLKMGFLLFVAIAAITYSKMCMNVMQVYSHPKLLEKFERKKRGKMLFFSYLLSFYLFQ